MPPYRLKSYLYLLFVAAIWGIASPIIKFTLTGIDPFPFLAYRFALAGLFSLIFFLVKGIKIPRSKETFLMAGVYGVLAAPLALGALFWGLDRSTVLDLTLIGAVGPLMVTLGAAVLFRDRITSKERLGILIVLLGVLINSFYPLLLQHDRVEFTGNLFLIMYLVADSGSILVAKKAVRDKIPSITLTNLAFVIGALTLIPLTALTYGTNELVTSITTLPLKYHLGVWYMAFISGNLAYFLYVRGQRSIEASEAVLFNYLQPLFTIPLAIFWLHEKLTPSFVIGALIIALGLYIAEKKNRGRKIGSKTV